MRQKHTYLKALFILLIVWVLLGLTAKVASFAIERPLHKLDAEYSISGPKDAVTAQKTLKMGQSLLDRELTEEEQWRLYLYYRLGNYKEYALMRDIIFAESSWRQYENGTREPLRGRVHSCDTGLLQINLCVHAAEVERQGLDVRDPYENIDFGLYLYERDGLSPWEASRHNWE